MSKRKVLFTHWNDETLRKLHNPFDEVPSSVLENYRKELQALIQAADKEKARLSAVYTLVCEAQTKRTNPPKLVIADHAIVRYMERYLGFDVQPIVDAIVEMAENADPEVAIREGVIITVLPPGSEADNLNHCSVVETPPKSKDK